MQTKSHIVELGLHFLLLEMLFKTVLIGCGCGKHNLYFLFLEILFKTAKLFAGVLKGKTSFAGNIFRRGVLMYYIFM
jgi:hypothetical protein